MGSNDTEMRRNVGYMTQAFSLTANSRCGMFPVFFEFRARHIHLLLGKVEDHGHAAQYLAPMAPLRSVAPIFRLSK